MYPTFLFTWVHIFLLASAAASTAATDRPHSISACAGIAGRFEASVFVVYFAVANVGFYRLPTSGTIASLMAATTASTPFRGIAITPFLPSPTASATPSQTKSSTQSRSGTPSSSGTQTASRSQSVTRSQTQTQSRSQSQSRSPTSTRSRTQTPSVGAYMNVMDSNINSFNKAQLVLTGPVVSDLCSAQKYGYSLEIGSTGFVVSRLDLSVASPLGFSVGAIDFLVEVWIVTSPTQLEGPVFATHAFGTVPANASRGYTSLVLPSIVLSPNEWYAVTISPQLSCATGMSMYRSATNTAPTAATGVTSIAQVYSQDNGVSWTAPGQPYGVFRLVAAEPSFAGSQVRVRA